MRVLRGRRAARISVLVFASAALCAQLFLLRPRASASDADPGALRVLLVGNSYTRFNLMPQLIERLASSAQSSARLEVDVEARGGSTLRRHWRQGRALSLIRSGRYTHVVLQDHSLRTIDRPGEFTEYVARFARAIEAANARAVLYGTWPRHPSARLYRKHPFLRSFAEMAEIVHTAYRGAADRVDAQLAPVGQAFERALAAHPEVALYRKDATHPTLAGSFLAACVLYGTLTGDDPTDAPYVPYELDAREAEIVKQIARETLATNKPP